MKGLLGSISEDPLAERARLDDDHLAMLIAFTLGPSSNCIDVGAHNGLVLRQMVRCAPEGRHIAYEPLPHLAKQLAADYPEVDVRCAALADVDGVVNYQHVTNFPEYSGIQRRSYPGEPHIVEIQVRTETLDQHLPLNYVPALIKIDVEGAEMLVMRGAEKTIVRHRPLIVFEHGLSAAQYGTTGSELFAFLTRTAGMRIYDLDGNGPYSERQFTTATRWNFLARG